MPRRTSTIAFNRRSVTCCWNSRRSRDWWSFPVNSLTVLGFVREPLRLERILAPSAPLLLITKREFELLSACELGQGSLDMRLEKLTPWSVLMREKTCRRPFLCQPSWASTGDMSSGDSDLIFGRRDFPTPRLVVTSDESDTPVPVSPTDPFAPVFLPNFGPPGEPFADLKMNQPDKGYGVLP